MTKNTKTTQNPAKGLLVLITIAGTVLTQCDPSCSSCGTLRNKEYCFVCKRSTWNLGGCDLAKKQQNCLYHSAAGCVTCERGYILDRDTTQCVEAGEKQIKNCLIQWMQTNPYTGKGYIHGCNVCEGAAPSVDQTECNRSIPEGCLWGGYDDLDQATCARCKGTGQISVDGKCVGSFTPGCIMANARAQCIECYDGFYMKHAGLCVPDAAPDGLEESGEGVQKMRLDI